MSLFDADVISRKSAD